MTEPETTQPESEPDVPAEPVPEPDPPKETSPEDRDWLAVPADETWAEFVDRMRLAPHIQQANGLAELFTPDKSFTVELQQYMSAKKIDKTVRTEADLPKVVALIGVIQSYRERVSSTQIGLMDMARDLKRAWKECEAWLMLHPYMNKKKDGDRKRAVHLILKELVNALGDVEHLIKAAETATWTLKQAADSYSEQKQGITTMIYSGMKTGATPEHVR